MQISRHWRIKTFRYRLENPQGDSSNNIEHINPHQDKLDRIDPRILNEIYLQAAKKLIAFIKDEHPFLNEFENEVVFSSISKLSENEVLLLEKHNIIRYERPYNIVNLKYLKFMTEQ